MTSWTVALPTAASMASAPTVSHWGVQRLLTWRCQWVPMGSSRGSTDLGSVYMGNITYLPARHLSASLCAVLAGSQSAFPLWCGGVQLT